MKKRITDLLDDLPVELLEERDESRPGSFLQRKKKLLIVIAVIAAIMIGCSSYMVFEMPNEFKDFFSDSDDELIDDLYIEYTDYVDYEDYRLAVRGIVSDVDSKKLLLTVTAISDEAKKDFRESCPTPILIKGEGTGRTLQSYISSDDQYTKRFYYELQSSATEYIVVLHKGADNVYEFYSEDFFYRVMEIFENLMEQESYSDEKAHDTAIKQALEEKAVKYLSFSIAGEENDEILLEINKNNATDSYTIDEIKITRTTLTIFGKALSVGEADAEDTSGSLEYMDAEPTVSVIFRDGTEKLLLKGTMGYETGEEALASYRNKSGTYSSTGEFNIYRSFIKPIDLDKVIIIKVNGIEYFVN